MFFSGGGGGGGRGGRGGTITPKNWEKGVGGGGVPQNYRSYPLESESFFTKAPTPCYSQ